MTDIGKRIRMDRIMNRNTKKTIIVPLDHGISIGPVKGLQDIAKTINRVAEGGANAVLLHKGIICTGYRGYGRDIGLIMHLSASTNLGPDPNNKVEVATLEEAIKYGADAVSVHINIGSDTEPEQLVYLGRVACECEKGGIPLVAMMYPRGRKIKNQYNVDLVKHAARVGAELGADIIKTNYTGDESTFREVVKGCPVPVVMAGGPKAKSDEEFFRSVYHSIEAGGAGVAAGRNVFQADNPTRMVRVLYGIIHDGLDVKAALKKYKK